MNEYELANAKLLKFQAGELKVRRFLANSGKIIRNVIYLNQNRYEIMIIDGGNIFMIYKNDPFYTFGNRFLGHDELGDTINLDDLEIALEHEVKEIYSAFSDGKVYFISMKDFLNKMKRWKNREGKEVASISLNEYKIV